MPCESCDGPGMTPNYHDPDEVAAKTREVQARMDCDESNGDTKPGAFGLDCYATAAAIEDRKEENRKHLENFEASLAAIDANQIAPDPPADRDTVPPVPADVLTEAATTVRDRAPYYGRPKENFGRVADGWSTILGAKVTPRQVALCMVWLKVCRDVERPQRDNLVDIAGYAGLAECVED